MVESARHCIKTFDELDCLDAGSLSDDDHALVCFYSSDHFVSRANPVLETKYDQVSDKTDEV